MNVQTLLKSAKTSIFEVQKVQFLCLDQCLSFATKDLLYSADGNARSTPSAWNTGRTLSLLMADSGKKHQEPSRSHLRLFYLLAPKVHKVNNQPCCLWTLLFHHRHETSFSALRQVPITESARPNLQTLSRKQRVPELAAACFASSRGQH